jgi:hypothetical protein
MRYFVISCAVLLIMLTMGSLEATAKGPQSSGSGQSGNWHSGWYGHPGYGYGGYNYGYGYPGYTYTVERPIVENPLPAAGPIKITNPAANKVTLNYMLNGNLYTIPPGYSQDLPSDRGWVVEFNRGVNFGQARYGLEPGLYKFSSTDRGWELFHYPVEALANTAAAPENPPPAPAPAPAPTNPVPQLSNRTQQPVNPTPQR